MKTVTIIGLAVSLAGCSERWTKIGVTDQRADADLYQCQRENRNASNGEVLGPNGDFAQEELVRQCMRAQGYRSTQ